MLHLCEALYVPGALTASTTLELSIASKMKVAIRINVGGEYFID